MSEGLLSGVLPFIFSQSDRLKRNIKGWVDDPAAKAEQTAGILYDTLQEQTRLQNQAFGDPKDPLKITDQRAFNAATQGILNGVMGFAPAGMIAYHGSPSIFSKFDPRKIGTGDGAQAYGHGTYLAEAPEVAKAYRPSETSGALYKVDLPDSAVSKMLDWNKPISQQPEVLKNLTPETMGLTLTTRPDGFMAYQRDGKTIGLVSKADNPEMFRQKWMTRLKEMGDAEDGAGRLVGYLGGTSASGTAPVVSQSLRQAGVPGIRYLDQGYKEVGKGTNNFVVFPGEEGILSILERNGQPVGVSNKMRSASRK